MGCSTCSSGGGVPNGCKSNGNCGAGSCGKLSVFDWLADVDLPNGQSTYDIVEVRFKSSRKAFFRNLKGIQLQVGDVIAVEASPGYDIGVVSVVGELARIQVRKKTTNFKAHEARTIYRKATKEDVEKWMECRELEKETMFASRKIASELALQMKISDVEYQGDGTKATFYYTADDRVDFRQLIRSLAEEFKSKIEMKQIGVRQEAARLGGIGSCGRELCCATWLTDFRSVSTASARYQQLSLNPQKLAGQCGKLKCCLNFELDAYLEALKKFPSSDIRLKTEKGMAFHVKTDVFKEQMWYIQEDRSNPGASSFIPLSPDRVADIIEQNKAGKFPADLKDYMVEVEVEIPDYTDVLGQDSLSRFEHVFKQKKKKSNKPKLASVVNSKQDATVSKTTPNIRPEGAGKKPNKRPNKKKGPNPNDDKAPVEKTVNPNQRDARPKPAQPRRKKPVAAKDGERVKEVPEKKVTDTPNTPNSDAKPNQRRKPNSNKRKPNPATKAGPAADVKSTPNQGKDEKPS